MQTPYVDKYEERLKIAIEKADYIASVEQYKIPSYEYLGAATGRFGINHYYYDKSKDKFYYESDFARKMRFKIRNSRFKNHAKK